jgi:uncharacterized OB-fold protein
MADRPVPNTTDPDTGGHFRAAREGELAVRACTHCGQVLHLPKAYCHGCGSWETAWRSVRPAGTLWSYTTTHRQLRAGFDAPYTVVVVDLDEVPGTRLIGHLPGAPELTIGMPMRATFERLDDEVSLPRWEPVAP